MPNVFDENGFRGQIYTDDHLPPHIHVFKAGSELIIFIDGDKPTIRRNKGMDAKMARKALSLVVKYQEQALKVWEEIHG